MARYDYRCPTCHHVFEVEHGMNEKPKVLCPKCGAEASRIFEATGITLKGSGFYNTDMRDGSKGASTTPAPSENAGNEADGSTSTPSESSASSEGANAGNASGASADAASSNSATSSES